MSTVSEGRWANVGRRVVVDDAPHTPSSAPQGAAEGVAIEIYSPGADTPEQGGPATWAGRVPGADPEAVFRFFNRVDAADAERLRAVGYRLPSLSVGDIISYTGTDQILIVCPTGFGALDQATVQSIINAPDPHLAAQLHAVMAPPAPPRK